MNEGKQANDWSHTSHVLCILANANRDPKRHGPYRPQDFNPTVKPVRIPDAPITVLRDVFIDKKTPVT